MIDRSCDFLLQEVVNPFKHHCDAVHKGPKDLTCYAKCESACTFGEKVFGNIGFSVIGEYFESFFSFICVKRRNHKMANGVTQKNKAIVMILIDGRMEKNWADIKNHSFISFALKNSSSRSGLTDLLNSQVNEKTVTIF